MLLTEDSHCILGHRDIKVKWKWAVLPGQLMGTGDPSFRRKASGPKPRKFSLRTPGRRRSWSGTELGRSPDCELSVRVILRYWGATEGSRQEKGPDCRPGERKPGGGAYPKAVGTFQAEDEAWATGVLGREEGLGVLFLFMPVRKGHLWAQLLWPQTGKVWSSVAEPPTSHGQLSSRGDCQFSGTAGGHLGPCLQKACSGPKRNH